MGELDDLANLLFRVFARTEYALKAVGHHKGDGNAEPDWTAFAETVRPVLENPQGAELTAAVQYLLAHPPKKQIIRDGVLDWSDDRPRARSQADLILLYVRRARNNLFHGGKFNGRWFEPERSADLLRHCLAILSAVVDGSDAVRAAYQQE